MHSHDRLERRPAELSLPPVGSARDDGEAGRIGSHDYTE
jgi:hypothetical protein